MTISVAEAEGVECWFDSENLWVRLKDGRQLGVPLTFSPRLYYGSDEQRRNFRWIARGQGIHWPELDEDISIEGLLKGRGDNTKWGREHRRQLGSLHE